MHPAPLSGVRADARRDREDTGGPARGGAVQGDMRKRIGWTQIESSLIFCFATCRFILKNKNNQVFTIHNKVNFFFLATSLCSFNIFFSNEPHVHCISHVYFFYSES